jgi:hypothetical protein
MPLIIEQGKMLIETMLRKAAKEQGVKLARVLWRQTENDQWLLEADNAETGRRGDKKFSPKHLTDYESDNQMKEQVAAMIIGLVLGLKK